MEDSKLKMHSLGVVAKDKPTQTDMIVVMPIEHITDKNTDINEETNYESKSKDHKKVPNQVKTVSKNTIEAKWLPFGDSNRVSAPDVMAGETVMLFTYSDTNEYYWTTMMREPSIRRLEKVLYGYSNLSSGARTDGFNRDTSYWQEVDTMNKYVKFHTSDNDGEFTTYDITINTKEGSIEIKDGVGNFIYFDSPAGLLHAKFNTEVRLEAPLVRFIANHVVNEAPLVTNTGNEETEGHSLDNPHINCVN